MFCPHCGKSNDDVDFCTSCGGSMHGKPEIARVYDSAPPAESAKPKQPNHWGDYALIGFISLLIPLVGFIWSLFYLVRNDEHKRQVGVFGFIFSVAVTIAVSKFMNFW